VLEASSLRLKASLRVCGDISEDEKGGSLSCELITGRAICAKGRRRLSR